MDSEEDDIQLKIKKLKSSLFVVQNEVKFNAHNYDAYIQIINKSSELYSLYSVQEAKFDVGSEEKKVAAEQTAISFNRLRNARRSMSTLYPLTIELWIQWIEDEMNAPPTLNDHVIIQDIFQKALVDYLSVDIWVLYVKYLTVRLEQGACASITSSFVRDTFEKAVTNCGLHYQDGSKIWEAYQQFEMNFLIEAKLQLEKNNNSDNIENYKLKLLNVIKLFKREMSIPLAEHDQLYEKFLTNVVPYTDILKSFDSESIVIDLDEIKKFHEQTLMQIESESIKIQEDSLEKSQYSLEAYQSYILHEMDRGVNNPARLQCIFERALVHHCLKSSIWLDYIDFLNSVIKLPNLVLDTCKRALRNVTWDSRLYIKYAIILESNSHEYEEIKDIYEAGLQKYAEDGCNYYGVWMSYVSFEKRISKSDMNIIKKKPLIYQLIQQAIYHLEKFDEPHKFIMDFILFWVDIERFWFKDDKKAMVIWKYMALKFRNNYQIWTMAINFARMSGNIPFINDLFNVGLTQFPNEMEYFSQSWLNSENIHGSLASYNHLEKKINIFLQSRLMNRKTKENLGIKSKTEHQIRLLISWLQHAEEELFNINEPNLSDTEFYSRNNSVHSDKRPSNINHKTKHKSHIRYDEGSKSTTTGSLSVNSSNKQHGDISSTNSTPVIGPTLPPGFIFNNNSNTSPADSDDELDNNQSPPSKKKKPNEETVKNEESSNLETDEQNRTVFVSNLHPATKDSDLKIIFSRAGDVQKVDLHRVKGGKIFAFVTYATPEEALKAFELEHTPIYNRPVYVSEFKHTKEKYSAPHYSQQQEKNKLFVSNLAKTINPNDLEKIFNQHGSMISLRLINKKGSSKPFAYVEYKTEEAASRARDKANNTLLKGRMINVEFSNPSAIHQSGRTRQPSSTETSPKTSEGHEMEVDVNEHEKTTTDKQPLINPASEDKLFKKPPTVPFAFIPMQARNSRNLQSNREQVHKRSKGPAVRLNFEPTTKSSNKLSPSGEENSINQDKNLQSAIPSSPKSNDDFRKMLLEK
ncbi:spliceosome associated factor 3, U4/U6 recycling protein-like [Lycorma delicatula]|uniref:spliceosome associated factor 3, U4/U6 recycling protein-like n=1 Tax=Lycorma delicatula TaxID=130591 RepID=UPI003F50DB05